MEIAQKHLLDGRFIYRKYNKKYFAKIKIILDSFKNFCFTFHVMKIQTLPNVYDENTTEARTDDYPYGRLRCTAKWWIEDNGKKGMRVCFQTINPKTGRINAVKKGTYSPVVVLFREESTGHFVNESVSPYSDAKDLMAFVEKFDLREKDLKFLCAWIAAAKKQEEIRAARGPIEYVIRKIDGTHEELTLPAN